MPDEIEIEFKDKRTGKEYRIKGKPELVDEYLKKFDIEAQMKDSTPIQVTVAETHASQVTGQPIDIGVPDRPEATSITGYVTKLINSPWGVNGRTSPEIMEMARNHGISSLPMSTLAGILVGLANSTKIRRVKRPGDKMWRYYPSTSYTMARGSNTTQ